jgi:hypothetical protein
MRDFENDEQTIIRRYAKGCPIDGGEGMAVQFPRLSVGRIRKIAEDCLLADRVEDTWPLLLVARHVLGPEQYRNPAGYVWPSPFRHWAPEPSNARAYRLLIRHRKPGYPGTWDCECGHCGPRHIHNIVTFLQALKRCRPADPALAFFDFADPYHVDKIRNLVAQLRDNQP